MTGEVPGWRWSPMTVWHNWLGIWHASVPLTGSRHRDARLARQLISAALAEKYDLASDDVRSVHVTRAWITDHGTVVYRETK